MKRFLHNRIVAAAAVLVALVAMAMNPHLYASNPIYDVYRSDGLVLILAAATLAAALVSAQGFRGRRLLAALIAGVATLLICWTAIYADVALDTEAGARSADASLIVGTSLALIAGPLAILAAVLAAVIASLKPD